MKEATKIMRKLLFCAIMLSVLTMATSCKFGRAINDVKDQCPIVLDDGVTITNVESTDKTGVKISIRLDITEDDAPYSNAPIWSDIKAELRSLMEQHPTCAELLRVANKDNKSVSFYIYDNHGKLLHSPINTYKYPTLN